MRIFPWSVRIDCIGNLWRRIISACVLSWALIELSHLRLRKLKMRWFLKYSFSIIWLIDIFNNEKSKRLVSWTIFHIIVSKIFYITKETNHLIFNSSLFRFKNNRIGITVYHVFYLSCHSSKPTITHTSDRVYDRTMIMIWSIFSLFVLMHPCLVKM